MTMRFESRKLVISLLAVLACLIVANTLGLVSTYVFGHSRVWGLVPLFNFNRETNIPTFFNSMLLLFCSTLLMLIAVQRERRNAPFHRYWKALSAVFLYLSIDEYVALHERLDAPIRTALDISGVLYFAWVIPYGVAVLILLIVFLRFIRYLPPTMRRRTLSAAFVYVGGALGIELIGGYYFDLAGGEDAIYGLITMLEESLEMFGLVLFIHALTSYLEVASGAEFEVGELGAGRTWKDLEPRPDSGVVGIGDRSFCVASSQRRSSSV